MRSGCKLMSTRTIHLAAAGAVVNGFDRDTHEILKLGFPTFSRGTYALNQRVRPRPRERLPLPHRLLQRRTRLRAM